MNYTLLSTYEDKYWLPMMKRTLCWTWSLNYIIVITKQVLKVTKKVLKVTKKVLKVTIKGLSKYVLPSKWYLTRSTEESERDSWNPAGLSHSSKLKSNYHTDKISRSADMQSSKPYSDLSYKYKEIFCQVCNYRQNGKNRCGHIERKDQGLNARLFYVFSGPLLLYT